MPCNSVGLMIAMYLPIFVRWKIEGKVVNGQYFVLH